MQRAIMIAISVMIMTLIGAINGDSDAAVAVARMPLSCADKGAGKAKWSMAGDHLSEFCN